MKDQHFRRTKVFGRRLSRPLKAETQEIYDKVLPCVKADLENLGPYPVNLEIGFGGGEHLAAIALMNPGKHYIGCEPFINGVGSLTKHIHENNIKNIRIHDDDARLLVDLLPNASLENVYLLFADPWPKKRHFKRRFVQKEMIEMIHKKLQPKGRWFIATDHESYREWVLNHFDEAQHLFKQLRSDIFERPCADSWPITRYEKTAALEGRKSGFMVYEKI